MAIINLEKNIVQEKTQFDDRIRNLIALAQDESSHSRTLLFSHICDLFLQNRPMASETQVRMLSEILKELIGQVDLSARQEVATALLSLNNPPEVLINIMCEDVTSVSGPLLEKLVLPDDRLIHIIRYGTETHRIHISRRFGLSPLVRHELDKALNGSKLKYSLTELDKQDEDTASDLDENTTSDILELLRAQKIHPSYGEKTEQHSSSTEAFTKIPLATTRPLTENLDPKDLGPEDLGPEDLGPDNLSPQKFEKKNVPEQTQDERNPNKEESYLSFVPPMPRPVEPQTKGFTPPDPLSIGELSPTEKEADPETFINISGESIPNGKAKNILSDDILDLPPRDNKDILTQRGALEKNQASNDHTLPNSSLYFDHISSDMTHDIWQQIKDARRETVKQKDFIRTIADWFWEIDRTGAISFISEEAFAVFGRSAADLVGEDFISLCSPYAGATNPDTQGKAETPLPQKTFDDLFEHRASFRDIAFYISSQNEEKNLWYLSAIAIFDIHSGRFKGFRGTARTTIGEQQPPLTTSALDQKSQEKVLEEYITAQALKAVSQKAPPETPPPMATPNSIAPAAPSVDNNIQPKASSEKIASELLQNLSHEFRTPLNAIIGFSEMIDMEAWGPVNKQYHHNIKNILTAAGLLKEAVNDVLDSAKLEAGLMEISPESFSLKTVLKDCLENVDEMAREHHVQLQQNDNNIDVILYNDKQSVELCLTKILTATLKKSSGHEVLSPSVLINSNAQVRIEIPLLGPEIREENAPKIFQKLQTEPENNHITSHMNLKYEPKISSGFGLSIAQNLAHMIGGDISAHSVRGRITHLVLTLSNHKKDN